MNHSALSLCLSLFLSIWRLSNRVQLAKSRPEIRANIFSVFVSEKKVSKLMVIPHYAITRHKDKWLKFQPYNCSDWPFFLAEFCWIFAGLFTKTVIASRSFAGFFVDFFLAPDNITATFGTHTHIKQRSATFCRTGKIRLESGLENGLKNSIENSLKSRLLNVQPRDRVSSNTVLRWSHFLGWKNSWSHCVDTHSHVSPVNPYGVHIMDRPNTQFSKQFEMIWKWFGCLPKPIETIESCSLKAKLRTPISRLPLSLSLFCSLTVINNRSPPFAVPANYDRISRQVVRSGSFAKRPNWKDLLVIEPFTKKVSL